MLVKKKSLQPRSKRNLFLQVDKYSDDKRFIAGTDLETGEKVWATLTDKGHYAGNSMRPTVADFANPSKNVYVAPGGVIVCARAFNFDAKRPDAFASTWLNVAAPNAEAVRKNIVFNQDCSFTIHQNKNKGTFFGCVTLWNRERIFLADGFDDLRRKICESIDANTSFRSGFVIRAMNKDDEVIGYEYMETRYNTQQGRVQTGLEAITYLESEAQFKELEQLEGFAGYNVLPSTLHTVSPRRFAAKEESFKAMETLYWTEDKVASLARKGYVRHKAEKAVAPSPSPPFGGAVEPSQAQEPAGGSFASPPAFGQ
jgi:hypothetical protein